MTSETQTLAGQSPRVVSYTYDADGLRTSLQGSAGVPPASFTLCRTLTWGTDLVGLGGSPGRDLQAAGGVGGLLMVEEIHSTTTTAASCRYDAFGNTLVATGTYSQGSVPAVSHSVLIDSVRNMCQASWTVLGIQCLAD